MAYKKPLWRSIPRPGEMHMVPAPTPPEYQTPVLRRRRPRRNLRQAPRVVHYNPRLGAEASPENYVVRRQLFAATPISPIEPESPDYAIAQSSPLGQVTRARVQDEVVAVPVVSPQGESIGQQVLVDRVYVGEGNRAFAIYVDEDCRESLTAEMAKACDTIKTRLNSQEDAEKEQLNRELKLMQKHRRTFLENVIGLVRPTPIRVEPEVVESEPEDYGGYKQNWNEFSSPYIVDDPLSQAGTTRRSRLGDYSRRRRLFNS
ncbi:unnamed protein product [Timema podura]|uniref:Uncharacterized protein n=1 Tax=Timema podura TaxID=61482 RepID=A0ABN7NIJ1_TIMPD|nr:unnamed protein product [Timema podura]